MTEKLAVGVLISGRGSNLAALLAAAQDPAYPARVACVLSNRIGAPGLTLAAECGIPAEAVPHRDHHSRENFEAELDRLLRARGVQLVVLAGFMRVLTPGFISAWPDRMLNIHPSLLPAFRGLDTHSRAIAAGCKLHGCTVHFVRPELDEGPIVAQAAVPVFDSDTPDSLAARVRAEEHRLLPAAVAWFAQGRLMIDGLRVRVQPPAG